MSIPTIRDAIAVRSRRTPAGVVTEVTIDHTVREAAGEKARWRISTRPARLPPSEFDGAPGVNRRFTEGRAIRCVDLESATTLAALAYHLDERGNLPILITDVAVRTDPAWLDIASACVPLLKAYLHELAAMLGRPSGVGYFAPTSAIAAEYVRRYGFRRVAVPSAWRRSGQHYVEQPHVEDGG